MDFCNYIIRFYYNDIVQKLLNIICGFNKFVILLSSY